MARIDPSTGPMHGVHPKPNATPISGGANAPRRDGRMSSRRSRMIGSRTRGFQTAVTNTSRPMAITNHPAQAAHRLPGSAQLAPSPHPTKTAVKPATNMRVTRSIRAVDCVPDLSSSAEYPDINDR